MAPRARAGGLGDFIFKIDLHGALAVLAFTAVPLAVHKVAAIAIHFSHRRLQVVHVAFHLAVFRIFGAVFTSTLLPALTLMAELPCRHYVLPFNPAGAVLIFTHFIAAGFQIDNAFFPLPVDFTAAIKIARNVGIHFDASGFGLEKLLIPAAASGPLTAALNTATAKTCIRDIVNSVSKRARNVANEGAGCNQSDQKVSN